MTEIKHKNPVTSVRLPEPTRNQIDELAAKWGASMANIITIAIDRMYQQEITMNTETQTITVLEINTKPEHDPYTNIDGIVSRTYLKLDPRDRTVWVTQEYNDNSTPMDEWHGLVLTWGLSGHPSDTDMRRWIDDNMADLITICDGHEVHWNGNNHVGRLSDEARAISERIEFEFDNDGGPQNYYEYWTVVGWLEHSRDEITAHMSDEQLAALAAEWEVTEPHVVIDGSILDFVTEIRDVLRYEQETE